LPDWTWQALQDADLDRYKAKLAPRLDGLVKTIKGEVLPKGFWKFLQSFAVDTIWKWLVRGAAIKAFADGLSEGRKSLDPNSPDRQ
jgi:hypothetical protein